MSSRSKPVIKGVDSKCFLKTTYFAASQQTSDTKKSSITSVRDIGYCKCAIPIHLTKTVHKLTVKYLHAF